MQRIGRNCSEICITFIKTVAHWNARWILFEFDDLFFIINNSACKFHEKILQKIIKIISLKATGSKILRQDSYIHVQNDYTHIDEINKKAMNLLQDKIALITGSSRGLGAEIAKVYAANGAKRYRASGP
jgi:3-oxoacyl-ACP reductase-like protein